MTPEAGDTSRSLAKTASTTVTADSSGIYEISLIDGHGIASVAEPPRRLVIRADEPPKVVAGGPGPGAEAKPDDVVLVDVDAGDDVAVASVELHYAIRRAGSAAEEGPRVVPVELPGVGTASAKGQAALSLKGLQLRPGDAVSYRVRVADNRPAPRGPNVTFSGPASLSIAADAAPLAERRAKGRREGFQARLEAIAKDAAANRNEAEQLRYAADSIARGNGAWDAARQGELARREAEARAVEDSLQQLARDLDADPHFRPLARPARQVAEVEAESGREALEQAGREADPAKRLAGLRRADERLIVRGGRIDDLRRQFEVLARRAGDRDALRAAAERQGDLADRAAAIAEGLDPAAIEALRADQEAAVREVDRLVKDSPELKSALLAGQAAEADALARRARDLAEAQRAEARKAAAADMAGTLRGLAEDQRRIEDDARRLDLDVRTALHESGRGGPDVDALRRPVEPLQRGDVEAARQRLDEAESALRRLLREMEDAPGDPRAIARRLARRQEDLANRAAEAARGDSADAARRLAPLADRQEAIARLAAAIPVPEARRDAAREAVDRARKSAEALRAGDAKGAESRPREARESLQRLADQLPDPDEARREARRKLEPARNATDEAARDLANHLRETVPRPDKPQRPAEAAAELARRLESAARKQSEAAATLASLEVPPRFASARASAARRSASAAEAIRTFRERAPAPARVETRPVSGWRVVGPFALDATPPFDPSRPVVADAKWPTLKGPRGGRGRPPTTGASLTSPRSSAATTASRPSPSPSSPPRRRARRA